MMPVAIRRVYPLLIVLCLALSLTGCATTTATHPPEVPAMHSVSEIQDEYVTKAPDPWVGFNRSMYKFNYNLDKYFLLPIVGGYEFITPTVVQTGVSNFFNNIVEIRNLTNSVFQLKGKQSLTTLGRFVTNSTIGIAGLFDPATSLGMQRQDEDFGQTLGYWGVGTGNYVVLPLFGPSNARDTGGIVVDAGIRYAIASAINPTSDMSSPDGIKAAVTFVEAIDKRHQEKFRYYGTQHPFEYDLVRWLAGKKRELEVMK
ncbi:MAG TPA: VacJ family lipoprotein [Geobacteraceae bacterium]|nr:VacJ family lipoprotein [Geobacteraceae bacterium]